MKYPLHKNQLTYRRGGFIEHSTPSCRKLKTRYPIKTWAFFIDIEGTYNKTRTNNVLEALDTRAVSKQTGEISAELYETTMKPLEAR